MAPQVGLEPTTLRLTAGCSAIELLRSVVTRSCCFANILIIPKQLPSENTDAHYLRSRAFLTIEIPLSFQPVSLVDTAIWSSFEGLTRPCWHAIKIRLRKGLPRDVSTSSWVPPEANGNPTRPSSALLFLVLQWKRVRNSGHALAFFWRELCAGSRI